eukprot:10782120-Prorocentrum_lima.AAC.1
MTTPTYVTYVTDLPEVERLFNNINKTEPNPPNPVRKLTTQPTHTIIHLDLSNAFTGIPRDALLRNTRQNAPTL